MAQETSDLSAWKTFNDWVQVDGQSFTGESPGAIANASLSRANARYRAATVMDVSFEGMTAKTSQGYGDILSVAFAYSALESLESGIKAHKACQQSIESLTSAVVVDAPLVAQSFRAPGCERLRIALQKHLDPQRGKTLKSSLLNLEQSGSDVAPLAKAIRHLVFHGVFAPATIGYDKPSVQELLPELRQHTLRAVDEHFTFWLERRSAL